MSTIKANAYQIGIDAVTASNNFSLQTPTTPDGTLQLNRGNASTSLGNIFTVDANNNINFRNNPPGTCGRFQYTSTSVCTMVPFNGNLLNINGMNYVIPSAGVALSKTGLSASTTYNVYAYMSGSTMTLEASTTGHSNNAATGMEIKTGDATRTLVGKVNTDTSTNFAWTQQTRMVASWFNRQYIQLGGGFSAARNWSTAAYAELDGAARLTYLAWVGSAVTLNVTGAVQNNTAGGINAVACAFNSSSTPNQAITITCSAAGSYYGSCLSQAFENNEGANFVTPLCWVNAGTGTFTLATSATVFI